MMIAGEQVGKTESTDYTDKDRIIPPGQWLAVCEGWKKLDFMTKANYKM